MIYLDHNATTPIDPRVRATMRPWLERFYGNPSSLHCAGRLARDAVEQARAQVAALVGAEADQVIFTSGGTEANNLALFGLTQSLSVRALAVGATEHPSILEPAAWLHRHGHRVFLLPVTHSGVVDPAVFESLSASIGLISLMAANNETGVVHDIARIAPTLRNRGVWLHCDATQAAGRIPCHFTDMGLALMTLSAHKLYGPKGAGALIVDRDVPLEPMLHGGGQERNRRAGTENVAALVGFGKAAELARLEVDARAAHLAGLRARFEDSLATLEGSVIFAGSSARLPNTTQFGFRGMEGEALVMTLDRMGLALSSGSACASGGGQPSPVLLAMGYPDDVARTAVRVSFGQDNTEADVDALSAALHAIAPGALHFSH